jgi:hypothetical protein
MAYWSGDGAVTDRARARDWNTPAAIPSLVPAFPGQDREPSHRRPEPRRSSRCPEIDCVRHLIPPRLAEIAELRAAQADVGADRVLITWGVISEETYVSALAASLGMAFEPLFNTSREHCPLPDDGLIEAANTGMLPLSDRSGIKFVVAPLLVDSRRLVAVATSGTDIARRIRLTSTTRLHDFVTRHSAAEIERRAIDMLRTEHPELSAGVGRSRRTVIPAYLALTALAAFAVPGAATMVAEVMLGAVFLAWTGLRLLGLLSERFLHRRRRRSRCCSALTPSHWCLAISSRRRSD